MTDYQEQFLTCSEELHRTQKDLEDCHGELRLSQEALQKCQDALRQSQEELKSAREQLATGQGNQSASGLSLQRDSVGTTLLLDFFPTHSPMEATLEEMIEVAEAQDMFMDIHQFSEMLPGQTLQQHVTLQVQSGSCPGPFMEETLVAVTSRVMRRLALPSFEKAKKALAAMYGGARSMLFNEDYVMTPIQHCQEWEAHRKNLQFGNYGLYIRREIVLGMPDLKKPSEVYNLITFPVIILTADGKRHWGMVRQGVDCTPEFHHAWNLRDLQITKHSPICLTVLASDSGRPLSQNMTSAAKFGNFGLFNTRTGGTEGEDNQPAAINFLELLFDGHQEELEKLHQAVASGVFACRVEIVNPLMRKWMGLKQGQKVYHDVQVTTTHDPITLQGVFTVTQMDVTDTVLAQQAAQEASARLAEEQQRTDTLLQRQYELIECIGKVTDLGKSAGSSAAAALIEGVWRQMSARGREQLSAEGDAISMLELLGQGSYGKVYKGLWRGTVVAVKSMVLPGGMSGSEKHERMAIMEAAISSSLSHPNIVQTYTYSLEALKDGQAGSASGKVRRKSKLEDPAAPGNNNNNNNHVSSSGAEDTSGRQSSGSSDRTPMSGFEVRLVLEFCDCGSLRQVLDHKAFMLPSRGGVNYLAVLETAADIAKGMLQLHIMNVVHSDLKARNVLLRSNASEARGVTAKISDFGLSFKMDNAETHMSSAYQGTLTHMAPEVLLKGIQSKAADVYAFGITMWELYTGGHAFYKVPQVLLGHQITHEGRRPVFPSGTPDGYAALAKRCWDAAATARPDFEEILNTLSALREVEAGETPRLQVQVHKSPSPSSRLFTAQPPEPTSARPGESTIASSLPDTLWEGEHILLGEIGSALTGDSSMPTNSDAGQRPG